MDARESVSVCVAVTRPVSNSDERKFMMNSKLMRSSQIMFRTVSPRLACLRSVLVGGSMICLAITSTPAEAFCIYNHTKSGVNVKVKKGGDVIAENRVRADDRWCRNYKNDLKLDKKKS